MRNICKILDIFFFYKINFFVVFFLLNLSYVIYYIGKGKVIVNIVRKGK